MSAEADARRPARRPWGSRGSSPAGWRCRPGPPPSRHRSRRGRRRNVAPSRHRPTRRPGRPRRRARGGTASAPACSWTPRATAGRRSRARRATSRSSVSPPPSCLRVWATTATVVMPTPPAPARASRGAGASPGSRWRARAASAVTRTARTVTDSAARPINAPKITSVGWCMPRYARAEPTATASSDHDRVRSRAHPTGGRTGAEQQGDGAPEDDRRRGVPGREARRAGFRPELGHVRSGSPDHRVDGEEGDQLEAERDRGDQQGPPASLEHEHDLEDEREHDDAHRVGGTRQEPGDAVEEPGAMVSQPPRRRLVPVAQPGQHADVHDELADAHEHGDHPDVAEDDDGEQRDDRRRGRESRFERPTDRPRTIQQRIAAAGRRWSGRQRFPRRALPACAGGARAWMPASPIRTADGSRRVRQGPWNRRWVNVARQNTP